MAFGALLFDLDGTLVDSHHEICLALAQTLRDVGYDLPFAQVQRLVDGTSLEAIWEKVTGRALEPTSYERFAHGYRSHYMRDLGHASALFPGVKETLSQLRVTCGSARFSVVSNKSAPAVRPLLARFDIADCFDLTLGCGGTPMPPKPHPALLLHAAELLNARPEDCVMIGDTAFDVEAGRRAGMRTVALTYGMASRGELERAGADHLIDDFAALCLLLTT